MQNGFDSARAESNASRRNTTVKAKRFGIDSPLRKKTERSAAKMRNRAAMQFQQEQTERTEKQSRSLFPLLSPVEFFFRVVRVFRGYDMLFAVSRLCAILRHFHERIAQGFAVSLLNRGGGLFADTGVVAQHG